MKIYRNYEIPEVSDLSTPKSIAMYPNIVCTSLFDQSRINIGVSMEDIAGMDEADANKLIYDQAVEVIDIFFNNQTEEPSGSALNGLAEAEAEAAAARENRESKEKVFYTTEEDIKRIEAMKTHPDISSEGPTLVVDNTKNEEPEEEITEAQIHAMVKSAKDAVMIMQDGWEQTKKEFKLTDDQMKQLYQWNEQNRSEMPEGLTEEEQEKWDRFNGLDVITEEEVDRIFGEGHPIIGVDFEGITKPRIKDAVGDFFSWLSALKEYRMIYDAYMQWIEANEEAEIDKLREFCEKEEDPEKKQQMQDAIDKYYYNKHLKFIAEPLSQKDIDAIVDAYGDDKKIEYWMKRTRDKLKTMKLSQEFILEISQLENRFMGEKYHCVSNVFLAYFMRYCAYANVGDPKSIERTRIASIVFALDAIVQNRCTEEFKINVMYNIACMLDQFIEPIIERYGTGTDEKPSETSAEEASESEEEKQDNQ